MQHFLEGLSDSVNFYNLPIHWWKRVRTNNPLERLIKEIRRRTNVVGAFPDGQSALLLISARAKYVAEKTWTGKTYMRFDQEEEQKAA